MSTFTLSNLNLGGIVMRNTYAGDDAPVMVRACITSDQPDFHIFMRGLERILMQRLDEAGAKIFWPNVTQFALLVRPDDTAELFVNDFPVIGEMLAKRDAVAGEVVRASGIGDIRRVSLPTVEYQPEDRLVICLKIGWRFVLFFDLHRDVPLDRDRVERELASAYRRMTYRDLYDALENEALFSRIVTAGWFPFIEIVDGTFEGLLHALTSDFDVVGEIGVLISKFDSDRIDQMSRKWWAKKPLGNRQAILQSGLAAYERNDWVASLKILLTEIEGIIRDAYVDTHSTNAKLPQLLEFACKNASQKAGMDDSLFFPVQFLTYLREYTFGSFDPVAGTGAKASRHTVGHGAARADDYTQERALQAILTVDQLAFYL
jgi:hypothetical protein